VSAFDDNSRAKSGVAQQPQPGRLRENTNDVVIFNFAPRTVARELLSLLQF